MGGWYIRKGREAKKEDPLGDWPQPIFRGQANGKELETTLERDTNLKTLSIFDYYLITYRIKKELETFTGRSFEEIPNPQDFRKNLDALPKLITNPNLETNMIEYWTYLRHHGFPSPLLDWTSSPYIAAHFAFKKIGKKVANVSVYAYSEYEFQSFTSDEPYITRIVSNLKADRRHYLQQSGYTYCWKVDKDDYVFSSHERVFSKPTNSLGQLSKFKILPREQVKALEFLEKVNINSYSLFNSEDALIEKLAIREFFLRQKSIKAS